MPINSLGLQASSQPSTQTNSTQSNQPPSWAYLQALVAWIRDPSTFLFGRWEGHPEGGFEGGVDLAAPGGTPVYALATGPLEGAGYFCHGGPFFNPTASCSNGAPGYGVVTQRINVPGFGINDLYYQHIDLDPSLQLCASGNCNGQIVFKGQRIGTIRPGINMLEMGFNADWGTIWGVNHPAQWVDDPRPLLKALVLDQSPSVSPTSEGFDISGLLNQGPTWAKYAAIIIIGLLFIIMGIYLLGGQPIQTTGAALASPIRYVKQRRETLKK